MCKPLIIHCQYHKSNSEVWNACVFVLLLFLHNNGHVVSGITALKLKLREMNISQVSSLLLMYLLKSGQRTVLVCLFEAQ